MSELLTVQEFANRYGVDTTEVRRWIRHGDIQYKLVGARHMMAIDPSDLAKPIVPTSNPVHLFLPVPNYLLSRATSTSENTHGNGERSASGVSSGRAEEISRGNTVSTGRPTPIPQSAGRGGSPAPGPSKPQGRSGGPGNNHNRR